MSTLHRHAAVVAAALALGAGALPGVPAHAASEVTVEVGDRVEPAAVTVAPGATITWQNVDDERHRIRSREAPEEFDSGNLEPGESFSVTLTAEGDYAYVDERDRDDPAYHGIVTITAGGGSATSPQGGGTAGPGGDTPGGASAPPSSGGVAILDRSFSPRGVQVAVGATVTWTNRSDRDHTVSFDGGGGSGVLGGGATFRRTFDGPGTFSYLCAIHPEMTGTVEVVGSGAAPPGGGPDPGAEGASSSGPPTGSRPAASSADGPSAGVASGRPADAAVRVIDLAFEPRSIEVAAGSTVTWSNAGAAPHTVTGAGVDSGILDPGASFRHRFAEAGTFDYRCELHPSMTGRVVVAAGAAGTATPVPGAGAGPSPAGEPAGGGGAASLGASDLGDEGTAATPSATAAVAARSGARNGPTQALLGAGLIGIVLGAAATAGTGRFLRRRRIPDPEDVPGT